MKFPFSFCTRKDFRQTYLCFFSRIQGYDFEPGSSCKAFTVSDVATQSEASTYCHLSSRNHQKVARRIIAPNPRNNRFTRRSTAYALLLTCDNNIDNPKTLIQRKFSLQVRVCQSAQLFPFQRRFAQRAKMRLKSMPSFWPAETSKTIEGNRARDRLSPSVAFAPRHLFPGPRGKRCRSRGGGGGQRRRRRRRRLRGRKDRRGDTRHPAVAVRHENEAATCSWRKQQTEAIHAGEPV